MIPIVIMYGRGGHSVPDVKEPSDRPSGSLSFEELYERYATDVLRVAYYYLGNRELAEDVTQDVFVKLITNSPSLEPGREKACERFQSHPAAAGIHPPRLPLRADG